MDQCGLETLCLRLPEEIALHLRSLRSFQRKNLEEIRVYDGAAAEFVIEGKSMEIPVRVEMDTLLAMLSAQALYRCEREMAMGYIPLPGGHRAGVCGRMVCQQDGTWRMTRVSSVCIRIGRHVPDASLSIRPYLMDEDGRAQRILVLGAPGSGKTTVLRDAALWLSRQGMHVAVADEREELFGGEVHQAGSYLDVLGGMEKAHALPMLIRSMAPQVIVTDEIGRSEDVHAVQDALRCGVGLLASAHALDMQDALRRPVIRELLTQRAFDWCVVLAKKGVVMAVYHAEEGDRWGEIEHGQLGRGRDGDDRHQRGRICAF